MKSRHVRTARMSAANSKCTCYITLTLRSAQSASLRICTDLYGFVRRRAKLRPHRNHVQDSVLIRTHPFLSVTILLSPCAPRKAPRFGIPARRVKGPPNGSHLSSLIYRNRKTRNLPWIWGKTRAPIPSRRHCPRIFTGASPKTASAGMHDLP